MNTPEFLEIRIDEAGRTLRVKVWREVADDDLRVDQVTAEQFHDWLVQNHDRVNRTAMRKLAEGDAAIGDELSIRPGELLA